MDVLADVRRSCQERSARDILEVTVGNSVVRLGNGVPGLLYELVTPGAKSEIGVFVMHAALTAWA